MRFLPLPSLLSRLVDSDLECLMRKEETVERGIYVFSQIWVGVLPSYLKAKIQALLAINKLELGFLSERLIVSSLKRFYKKINKIFVCEVG